MSHPARQILFTIIIDNMKIPMLWYEHIKTRKRQQYILKRGLKSRSQEQQ
ncbi:MAG: hypothetical protein QXT67_08430 [Candidatus Bathyarchaeia archaeon]